MSDVKADAKAIFLEALERPGREELLRFLDEALAQLAVEDPGAAQLVNLRFFAGLTLKEAADSLGLALRTAERQWAYARAWLYARLRQDDAPGAK